MTARFTQRVSSPLRGRRCVARLPRRRGAPGARAPRRVPSSKPPAPPQGPRRITVVLTTYQRPGPCLDVLRALDLEAQGYELSLRVYDDGSTEDYGPVRAWVEKRGGVFRSSTTNRGKRAWWRLIDEVMRELKHAPLPDVYLFLQDDMELIQPFLPRALALWDALPDPKKQTLYLLLDEARAEVGHPCWTRWRGHLVGDGTLERIGWVDFNAFVCSPGTLAALDWEMQPVPESRWERDPLRSSGVGEQWSRRLFRVGGMYRVRRSLVRHRALPSWMNPEERLRNPMRAVEPGAVSGQVWASLASIPSRERVLREVVRRLLPQVDRVNVYLNGYVRTPSFLLHPRVCVAHSAQTSLGDRGDVGKFYWCEEQVGLHLTCDDDILYPLDYVRTLRQGLARNEGRVIVGFHGAILREPLRTYHESREVLSFRAQVQRDTPVHVLGTGVLAWRPALVRLRLDDFPTPNMADIWLARVGQREQIPFVCLAHRRSWLRDDPRTRADSIYKMSVQPQGASAHAKDTRHAQTEAVREIAWRLWTRP